MTTITTFFNALTALLFAFMATGNAFSQCNFPEMEILRNPSFEEARNGVPLSWTLDGNRGSRETLSFSRSNGYQKCGNYYGLLTYDGTSPVRVYQEVALASEYSTVSLTIWGGIHEPCGAEFRVIFIDSRGNEIGREVRSVTKNVQTWPTGLAEYKIDTPIPSGAVRLRVEAGMRRTAQQRGIYLKMEAAVLTFTNTTLPVTLSQFDANLQENAIQLAWQTTRESNSGAFEVQHSADGRSWDVVNEVAARGDYDGIINYHYTHLNPVSGRNYYRLKMVDLDGSYEFSKLVSIHYLPSMESPVYPNPSNGKIYVRGYAGVSGVTISDATGRSVSGVFKPGNSGEIDLTAMKDGLYFVSWEDNRGNKVTRRVLLSR